MTTIDDLHQKYAPTMRFSLSERFFPMSLDDFLAYSALYIKGQNTPLVPKGKISLDDLTVRYNSREVFVRSVEAGPMNGANVAKEWGVAAIRLVYEYARNPVAVWSEEMARSAYDWFSEKTKPATRLFWWNGLLLPKAYTDRLNNMREDLPRFKLSQVVRNAAIENYDASQGSERNYTYYYRTMQQGDYMDLQYWFFYGYNDWAGGYDGFNDHEGDWEGFHVFFKLDAAKRPIEPPAYVCYLGHHSRMTKPWDHPDVQKEGTHPIIYVGAGSHASYPQPRQYPLMALYNLIDYATGEASKLDHTEWRNRIHLDTTPWLLTYLGSWGTRYWLSLEWARLFLGILAAPLLAKEVDLPGVSAPRGPKFSDEGGERATWSNPVEFAGLT